MIKISMLGIEGKRYKNLEEAWTAFYQDRYGSDCMDSKKYHELYLTFLSGSISSLNVQGTKFQEHADKGTNFANAVAQTMMEILNEALKQGVEEFRNSK